MHTIGANGREDLGYRKPLRKKALIDHWHDKWRIVMAQDQLLAFGKHIMLYLDIMIYFHISSMTFQLSFLSLIFPASS